jgi:hypothetical protein
VASLQEVTGAYNRTYRSSIGMSPFEAFRSRLPPNLELLNVPENTNNGIQSQSHLTEAIDAKIQRHEEYSMLRNERSCYSKLARRQQRLVIETKVYTKKILSFGFELKYSFRILLFRY